MSDEQEKEKGIRIAKRLQAIRMFTDEFGGLIHKAEGGQYGRYMEAAWHMIEAQVDAERVTQRFDRAIASNKKLQEAISNFVEALEDEERSTDLTGAVERFETLLKEPLVVYADEGKG